MENQNLETVKDPSRVAVIEKMLEYEKNGDFNKDVEDDPETLELKPDMIDYLRRSLVAKIKAKIVTKQGDKFFAKCKKAGMFTYKTGIGYEYAESMKGGYVITCNHINACDNYVLHKTIEPFLKKKTLYKVIREGNYTNFPGKIGVFFKHANTLPLSSNRHTMKKFFEACKILIAKGNPILIYPEQSMWWNYKKPRPMKNGAFKIAVDSNVPVLPCFITLNETGAIGGDGFPVLEYIVNFGEPIMPKKEFTNKANYEYLKEQNYTACVKIYEDFYKTKLCYEK